MRTLNWVSILCLCFVCGGATCAPQGRQLSFPPPPPVQLGETPTLQDVLTVVNRTDAIRELSTNSASVNVLSTPALPKLSATVNLQRDKNFRMQASLPVVMGAGIDMGSNQELFWLEVPEGISRTLYYARHDRFREQLTRSVLPVDPTWLIDAMGLVHIDPASVVAGPVKRSDGMLEIRSTMLLPAGMYQRVYFIDPSAYFVTNQFLYDPRGTLVASSVASNHRYYEEQQCVLPHRVKFDLTPAIGEPISMQIDVTAYAINQLLSGSADLFQMPQGSSSPIDLTTLATQANSAPAASAYTATRSTALPMRGTY